MKEKIVKVISDALSKIGIDANVELTESKGHADFATNVAMKYAKSIGKNPIELANEIAKNVNSELIEKVEVAGPGFINIFVKSNVHSESVKNIIEQGDSFGKGDQGKYINVEFVSANPTGYLHLGHARNAALGETLSSVLQFAGNKVDREYYINDAGNQMDILGESTFVRYQQELGNKIEMPEDSYRGEEIVEAAKILVEKFGNKYKDSKLEEVKAIFSREAEKIMLDNIKKHLGMLGVKFDIWYSERTIHENNLIIPALKKMPTLYEKDGATWVGTTKYGDDKDRVVIKSDGSFTYFAPDIAYHNIKLSRGYDELIDVWGGDHIGYVPRMKIALQELGLPADRLDIVTIQMVRLVRNGEEFKMSKRKGTTYTLLDLLDLVGKDAARFFLVSRANTSGMDFDIDIAAKQSADNPVFTVQYTHARANQVIEKSTIKANPGNYVGKEIEIINKLNQFPKLIIDIANTHKVHLLPQYLIELCHEFNSFYSNTKIIGTDRESELVALVIATKQVIKNALNLIGVSQPNKM